MAVAGPTVLVLLRPLALSQSKPGSVVASLQLQASLTLPDRSHSNRQPLGNGGQMGAGAPPPSEGRELASGTPSGCHMDPKMLL